ncbi:TrbI/VirB10 family protein, partial [Cetobacterium sp.]
RYDDDDWRVAAAQGGGEQIISIGNTMANKILGIQPTIEVAPGSRFNVIVNSDIILTPYK